MKTSIFVLLLLICCCSCKKKGCMDSAAPNYDDEAEKDDGSCEPIPPAGTVHFWFDQHSLSSRVTIDNDTRSTYYDYEVAYPVEPSECGVYISYDDPTKSGIVFILPPGTYDYVGSCILLPQKDTIYYQTGTVTIVDNNCELIQIK